MERLKGKTALVTGGAKGIGKAICRLFAEEGARIVVTDIVNDEGRQLAEEIGNAGGEAAYWHLDTSSEDNVARVFQKMDRLHILVNNAGIAGVNRPTEEIEAKDFDAVMGINVRGVFLCTKHALPCLRKAGGGSIVNLSSIYGLVGSPDLPPYHASKGAVRLMTKTDALFYAQEGIRVNSIHPGFIWTPLVEGLAAQSPEGVEAFREDLAKRHPIGHVGQPEDVAYGALYLASDESQFVTGSELVIDGGYTAH